MNLSVLSTQLLQPGPMKPVQQTGHETLTTHGQINKIIYSNTDSISDKVNINDELSNANLSSSKQRTNGDASNGDSNQLTQGNDATNKQISVSNLTFKDSNKYARILSAKLNKSNGSTTTTTTTEKSQSLQQPPSPIPFQSLQPESLTTSTEHSNLLQNKGLSPVTNIAANTQNTNSNTLFLNGQHFPQQYFNYRRHSNVLGVADQIAFPKSNPTKNQIPLNIRQAGVINKRDRDRLIDATLKPLTTSTTLNSIHTTDGNHQTSMQPMKESSPRFLPPPQWLTGNLKLTSQGKIGNAVNASNGNSKRRITDWKSVGLANNLGATHSSDLVLPNCPGASPKKSNSNSMKKKLSTLSSIYQDSNSLITPRNFSASSDHLNET